MRTFLTALEGGVDNFTTRVLLDLNSQDPRWILAQVYSDISLNRTFNTYQEFTPSVQTSKTHPSFHTTIIITCGDSISAVSADLQLFTGAALPCAIIQLQALTGAILVSNCHLRSGTIRGQGGCANLGNIN